MKFGDLSCSYTSNSIEFFGIHIWLLEFTKLWNMMFPRHIGVKADFINKKTQLNFD